MAAPLSSPEPGPPDGGSHEGELLEQDDAPDSDFDDDLSLPLSDDNVDAVHEEGNHESEAYGEEELAEAEVPEFDDDSVSGGAGEVATFNVGSGDQCDEAGR